MKLRSLASQLVSTEEVPDVVEDAFREIFEGIKPTDLTTVGFFQRDKDQLRENAEIARKILAAR